jgi:hypothetical protein
MLRGPLGPPLPLVPLACSLSTVRRGVARRLYTAPSLLASFAVPRWCRSDTWAVGSCGFKGGGGGVGRQRAGMKNVASHAVLCVQGK